MNVATSSWACCPARVDCAVDSTRAAFARLKLIVCTPLQRADWYELHAVATVAIASRIVTNSSIWRSCRADRPVSPARSDDCTSSGVGTSDMALRPRPDPSERPPAEPTPGGVLRGAAPHAAVLRLVYVRPCFSHRSEPQLIRSARPPDR